MKALCIYILALAGSAAMYAQTLNRVTADIPFAFEMANGKYPAGEYMVRDADASKILVVRNEETDQAAMLLANVLSYAQTETKELRLVFNKYGDRYFLSEVWYPSLSRQVIKSRSEKTLVTSTFITSNPTKVVIVARAF